MTPAAELLPTVPAHWARSAGERVWVRTCTAHTGTACLVLDTRSHKDIVTGTPADTGHGMGRRHKSVPCELMEQMPYSIWRLVAGGGHSSVFKHLRGFASPACKLSMGQ